jgi:hypothetical protein
MTPRESKVVAVQGTINLEAVPHVIGRLSVVVAAASATVVREKEAMMMIVDQIRVPPSTETMSLLFSHHGLDSSFLLPARISDFFILHMPLVAGSGCCKKDPTASPTVMICPVEYFQMVR